MKTSLLYLAVFSFAVCGCNSLASVAPLASQQSTTSANAVTSSAATSMSRLSVQGGSWLRAALRAAPAALRAVPAPGATAPPVVAAACSVVSSEVAGCPAQVRTDTGLLGSTTVVSALLGMTPGEIQQIYHLTPMSMTAGSASTVAIVVSGDDPAAESDLAFYRKTFGLPACTTANGCFKKISQTGTYKYPQTDTSWAVESSLDLDTVSAVCPGCKLLLVEAKSASMNDLSAAVDEAAASKATVINNSYGVVEAADNVKYDSHYYHPGIPIVVAAGDNAYGVMFPASSEHVIAVGGTSLAQIPGFMLERAWADTAAGCSAYIPKPAWQKDDLCPHRMMNDVGVVADPASGLAVYDSTIAGSDGGWSVIGGTSFASPIIASLIAMSPNPAKFDGARALYASGALAPILAGADGMCATYFCNATFALGGYNGPTGNGSPYGSSIFNT